MTSSWESVKWTETSLDLESSIFNIAWRWIWMENITATLCQWLYRANAGLQQMMQSYRAFALRVHWMQIECMENSIWIWQVRMAFDCDVESSTITSSIQRTRMRWVQISRFKKVLRVSICQIRKYTRLNSWYFQIVSRFSNLCRFFQSLMERYRALLKRTSASAWRARISMASLTVGQSYKSLAFDFEFGESEWSWNRHDITTETLQRHRLCSDLDGGAELPWGDTTFTVYISPISSILVQRGSSDTEWMSKEMDIF